MAIYMNSCLFLYAHFTETIKGSGEIVIKKLKAKNAFIEKIIFVILVHGNLHEELLISICSFH